MRTLRKLIAIAVYAALLLPAASDNRITRWVKAIEVTSTALDRTLRRRRGKAENDRQIRHLAILQSVADDEEKTERLKLI
ncbi:MAG TPA: hypothetical protein VMS98_19705 [Thermoanaerobaculia bacterium]|nr:hypothetical protein [Thermoanaerobaculia bacterium]